MASAEQRLIDGGAQNGPIVSFSVSRPLYIGRLCKSSKNSAQQGTHGAGACRRRCGWPRSVHVQPGRNIMLLEDEQCNALKFARFVFRPAVSDAQYAELAMAARQSVVAHFQHVTRRRHDNAVICAFACINCSGFHRLRHKRVVTVEAEASRSITLLTRSCAQTCSRTYRAEDNVAGLGGCPLSI